MLKKVNHVVEKEGLFEDGQSSIPVIAELITVKPIRTVRKQDGERIKS
jgi:hypothetical protein